MVNLQIAKEDIAELCARSKLFFHTHRYAEKDTVSEEDIWKRFCLCSVIGTPMLDEAQVDYVVDLIWNAGLFNRNVATTTAFSRWKPQLITLLETERKNPNSSSLKQSACLTVSRILQNVHNTLLSVDEYLNNTQPGLDKRILKLTGDDVRNLIADMAYNIEGIGFTRATLFFFEFDKAQDCTSASRHIEKYVSEQLTGKDYSDYDASQKWAIINNEIRKLTRELQKNDSSMAPRMVDLAIWLISSAAKNINNNSRANITSRDVLDFMDTEKMSVGDMIDVVLDLDEREDVGRTFTQFIQNRH